MPKPLKQITADYRSIVAPAAYAGNPLIESLPNIFSEDYVTKELRYVPDVATALEIALPPHERIHCVSSIEDLVIPLPVAFDVEAALSVLIRRGYAARNPFNREWRRLHCKIKKTMSEPLEEYQVRSKSVPAIMVTGVSGNGKTTLVETLLEMYSQVIVHTDYKGESFDVKQLVWIGVNASFDASLKGLVLSMFGAVDAALGTDYRQQYDKSTRTIDTMIGNLAQVFATHHLGVLFVDEIQCLMLRGDHEAELALSLFLKIANVCRVPIVFSGTYAAAKLFSKVARNARRVCHGGYFDLALPSKPDDVIWDKLIVEVVWRKFQWVKEPAPLTDDLRKRIFHLSQGIMAIFIALHRAAQVHAIRHNLDTVDSTVLQDVYDRQFVLMHPALAALRSKNKNRLEKFEDLLPPKEKLDALLRPNNNEILAERIERLLMANHDAAEKASAQSISPEQKKRNDADQATAELLKKIGSNAELKELARRAGLLEG